MTGEACGIRKRAPNSKADAHQAVFADGKSFFNDATATNKAARPHTDAAVQNRPGGNVAVIFDRCVVLKQCPAVDDAVVAHLSTGIDYGPVHDDIARPNDGVARDMGRRRYDCRHLKTILRGLLVKAHAEIGALDLSGGDQGVRNRLSELIKRIIRSNHFIAKMLTMYFFRHADQPDNSVLTLPLDHVDTRAGMAASTNKNQAGLAHEATGTKLELLGMLIKRCDSDSAMVRSILGQSLNCVNSCIKIQAGRVM